MAGIKALRKIQLGRETVAGTAVAATTIWRGLGTIEDTREIVHPDEDVGYLSGYDRTFTQRLGAALALDAVPATFEQVGHIFEAGVKLVGTGSADGVGSGKIYTYTFPTTSANSIKTYTIQAGDNTEAERMEYAFVEDFKLAGNAGEPLNVEASWKGRQVALNAFTGGLSVPTVEEVLVAKGKLYYDAVSGTHGGTLKSNTLLGVSLNVKTGWQAVEAADGNKYFSFAKQVSPEIVLEATFEHDAFGTAAKVDWRAETPKLIRLNFLGSALGTSGTTYSTKSLIVDLTGKWEKIDKLDEKDGNDILVGTFRARYDATSASFAKIIVVNELATVP